MFATASLKAAISFPLPLHSLDKVAYFSLAATSSLSLSSNLVFSSPISSTASYNLAAHFSSTSCSSCCKAYTCLCASLNLSYSFSMTALHSKCSSCAASSLSTNVKFPSSLGGVMGAPIRYPKDTSQGTADTSDLCIETLHIMISIKIRSSSSVTS